MNVLITGGAGYIGSHAVKALCEAGHVVSVLDNLDRGHRAAVPDGVTFHHLDLSRTDQIIDALRTGGIECVMHFAALAYVGESVEQPLRYYHNNTAGTLSLLRAMDAAGVNRMVFSSTCATYGQPRHMPITEDLPQQPVNPYGWSKLFIERMLRDYAATNDQFAFAALRYFNVAGCAGDGTIGEDHDPESHLVPLLVFAALGRRDGISIHGDNYDTADGTCIRDYVHVEDLVAAHIVVAEALRDGEQRFFNLGIGAGYSVKQMVESAKRVTGVDFPVRIGPRRPGDPPSLYADATKIQDELGWRAKWTDIDAIVETAWRWFKENPTGYGD